MWIVDEGRAVDLRAPGAGCMYSRKVLMRVLTLRAVAVKLRR
jgi:hypothetical protein